MSNTILTHQMIAREAAKYLSEEMSFIMNVNRNREDDATAKVNGYRKGGTLKIKIPPPSKVYDGATFAGGAASGDDQVETFATLAISTQKHVPLTFTATEKALSIDEYRERFLRPAMSTLLSTVQADMLTKTYSQIPNVVGTAGTVPSTAKIYSQARGVLQRHLAPGAPRTALISSDANIELVDASKTLFNPNKAVADMFMNGYLNSYGGMDFFENQALPLHTNGNKVSGVQVNGASQTGTTLNIKGVANLDTFKKGTIFTIAGVYEVHPLTGAALPNLRQFVITADASMITTTGSISIWPALDVTAPGTTVSALAADSAALTFVGSASTAYRQNLIWQRDAIACAFAPLPVLASCEGYTFDADGISLRVMTFGDGKADMEHTRIDVLYADPVLIYRDHAVRVTE